MSGLQDAMGHAGRSDDAVHNGKLRSEEDGGSVDKTVHAAYADDGDELGVTTTEQAHLKRGLEQRHLSMIALAGSIGTGLFLSLSGSIQTGGPLGALLGYAVVGAIVCSVQFALGEVSALLPVSGSFVRHAAFLNDPAWGFAAGWNLVYGNVLSIPSEISAICVLFQYWTDINSSLWIMVFILLTFIVGVAFVRVFGEVEFAFASLKLLTVVFLIIFGLVVNLGGVPGVERVGFRYWQTPGPFVEFIGTGAWGRFLGFWSVMTNAVFSFAGIESLAMAAAETRNPGRTIPRACKRVFFRIVLFYLLAVLVVGMLVASDDPRLNDESGTAAQSPFVIAVSTAGYSAVGSVVNAIVITSAWSSSNQALLAGTRVLYGLALKRQAPSLFLRTTSWGIPIYCVLFFTAFMFLSFMTLSSGALTVFYWFVALTSAGVLVSWCTVLFNHIRLKTALRRQGIPASELPWNNGWTLYSSYAGLVMCLIILFTGGFRVFTKGNWDANSFVSSYLDIPLVIVFFLGWKLIKKTRWVRLDELPLRAIIEQAKDRAHQAEMEQQAEDALKGNRHRWLKYISWIWD
ncbi:amino acid transporters [Moesziomyces antarcticus T-34]|uniref:Amino acid transporters n=1 Tax=Pseudozyma antarctica (strain T-34) TaxID=1151754 RepID=M9MGR4_PSEA3|nr:amino acid transporters [Moesziomyces antarcticus T-34]